ncbi:MAG TPA: hypothetical protein VF824_13285 [Thermoanaerobaculia bacterium]|jgi:elongation factor G
MSEKPILAFAMEPRTATDQERLECALKRLMVEDPALRVRTDPDTKQVIVAGMSERQMTAIIARLTTEFHVESEVGALRVLYKEMFTRAADGEGKLVSQTAGRSHYAHAKIRLFPGESGSGYVFANEIDSALIPAKFIGAIEHGISEAVSRRSIVRSVVDDAIDVRIELYDASYHDVDSSEGAFRTAGAMAFDDASAKAKPLLLEPAMRVEVAVSPDDIGPVMKDLSKRGAVIQSMEDRGEAYVIAARSPLSPIIGYERDLRALMGRRATCSIRFDGYEPAPGEPDFDEDGLSSVRMPRTPAPTLNDLSIGLREPDQDAD